MFISHQCFSVSTAQGEWQSDMIKGRTGLAQPYDTQEMSTDDSVWTLSSVTCCTARYRWSSETNRRTLIDLKEPFNASRVLDNLKHSCTECILKVLLWATHQIQGNDLIFSLQWLRALHSSRQSFNIVFGECPYCSKVCVCLTVWLTAAFRKPSIDIQLIN